MRRGTAWLSQNGVSFEERDVAEPAARAEFMKLGIQAVPVTIIETGDKRETVVGYQQQRLRELLAI